MRKARSEASASLQNPSVQGLSIGFNRGLGFRSLELLFTGFVEVCLLMSSVQVLEFRV